MQWPEGDPGKCRQAATAWRTFSKAVDGVCHATDGKSSALIHNNKGEAVDAYAKFWHRYHGGKDKGWLDDVAKASEQMAEMLEKYADAVEHARKKIEHRIEIDIAVLAVAIGAAALSGGALSGAALAVADEVITLAGTVGIEVSAAAAGVLGTAVASAAFGGVESVAVDAAIAQPLRMAAGLQDHFSLDELNSSAKDGMISGAIFGGAAGATKAAIEAGAFPRVFGDGVDPSLLSGLPTDLDGLGGTGKPPTVDVEKPPSDPIRPDDTELPANARDTNSTEACNDPVDIATGTMFMTQTDVTLPGQLPLVIERTHLSSYRAGGWFGRSWASTLDERLQLDARGVVFAATDGKRLVYPVPRAGQPVLPERGPRLALAWDGRPDGAMTITDPATGVVRTFTHPSSVRPGDTVDLPLESMEDRNGHRIDIDRTASGIPTAIRHSGGYHIAVDIHGARITALRLLHEAPSPYRPVADSPGTVLVRYGYDAAGNLAEVINSSGRPLRFGYDADGRITSWTDRNGTRFEYVYDERGRVVRTEGTDGFMSGAFTYDEQTRTNTYTNSLGETSVYRYNDACRVAAETDPLGHTTTTEWDPNGQHRLSVTDPLGRTTRYAYDEAGNLLAVTLPDGSIGQAAYNALNLPTQVTEPGGTVWRHTYDDSGNLLVSIDPTGAETRYAYDGSGHITSITDALGNVQRATCDAAGLPLAVTDPLGNTTTVTRDVFGRVVEVTDPLGHATRMGWTTEGKPKWREQPDGARESWEWDGEGNLVSHTDPVGNTVRHTTTHFDLTASRTDPDGTVYAFTYDTDLHLTGVTNPQGLTWTYEYDAAGRLVAETDFNGRRLTYAHDAAGQLSSRTNGAGESLSFTRDALGRTVATATDDGTETTFAYDAAGQLARAANPDAELVWERDALGRVLTETVNGRAMTYAYDATGRRVRRTTPGGAVSHWTYDAAGRPNELRTDAGSLALTYDAAGREVERRLGEDLRLTQAWDSTDRLTTQTVTHRPSGEEELLLQHRTYAYRPDGLLTEIRELTAGTRRFTLNKSGRVTAVTAHGWTETYAYDEAGNLTSAEAPAHPAAGDREFTGTLIHRAGRTTYEHDAQGRLTRKTRKLLNGQTRTWSFSWNAEDRLTDAVTPDGERWHYAYDPLGRRVAKRRLVEDGSVADETVFTWDDTRVAEQTADDGHTTTWDYAPGTHRPLTQSDRATPADPGSLIARLGEPARFHAVLTDSIGSPTELLTLNGEIAWQARTTLWGPQLPSPKTDFSADCPLRFPGQYQDPETGLNYNYFRYYDPETGRYISPDPLGLVPAPNHHAYVTNPCVEADFLGLSPCPEELSKSGQRPDKGRLTRAGREYQKHMNRGDLPVVPGKQLDSTGQGLLDDILNSPDTVQVSVTSGNFAGGTRYIMPDPAGGRGFGATFDASGNFQYFGRY
ncbi:DUF6531 domain-containing protein [Streptantibioticus ferralitis]|uniref:DUF6531 domain-containing protein n=1 Tax=Streptantibioticus ferralitis TaxID=236510 RepID=A0ABT5YSY7_9ACTN|nr:DUF6531 domain-containing protein [Streptantibioticus ferralitis]MDF2254446.1 DUF6531 domain-containing protein [Streptantibioticus ferralitis]